jgi:hypothetical protein
MRFLIIILLLMSFNAQTASIEFRNRLGYLESRNDYRAVNRFGYLGIYQFGHDALVDLGYKTRSGWACKRNICSKEDFLATGKEQERALDMWVILLESRADRLQLFYWEYSKAQIIAGCHLVGCFGVYKALFKNENVTDANKMNVKKWMKYFKGIEFKRSTYEIR